MLKGRVNTDCLRIRLGANQTGMTVAGVATNTRTLSSVLLVDPDPQRHVKWLQSRAFEIIRQMLYSLFVANCWILIRLASPGFSRILATVSVHLIKMFGFGVIRLQLVVTDGPCG